MTISDRLKALIDNPDDLTSLPGLIDETSKLETEYGEALDKVGELHELNRKYLKMIPVATGPEEKPGPEQLEIQPVTYTDAVDAIMQEIMS